jgi:MFS family permease
MMILFVAPIGGRLSGRVGPRWLMTVGMLFASIGLFGLSFVDVGTSYNAIWPFQMLMGAGMALTMPAVSATGMAAVDRTKAGIASGVINASRQVGGALGIAVLGSALTDRYQAGVPAHVAHAPAALAERAHEALPAALALAQQVGGTEGMRLVGQAQSAFVDGLGLAMMIAAATVGAAAVFVFWRAPREAVEPAEEDRAIDARVMQSLERG